MRQEIEAPVRKVLFYEDRAQVVRKSMVKLAGGSLQLVISGVSPVAVDGSLLVSMAGVRIDDVRVERRFRIGQAEQPEETARLTETLRELKAARSLAEGQKAAEDLHRQRMENAADLRSESVGIEIKYAGAFLDTWRSELQSFEAAILRTGERIASLASTIRDLDRKIAIAEAKLRQSGPFEPVLEASLVIDVTASADCEAELRVQYLVPCALWRPLHQATLTDGELKFALGAAAWQATGETWQGVEAAFSTARPARSAEPPLLSDDILSARKRTERQTTVTMREQEISTTGEGQVRLTDEIPGVDDGGESRLLNAPAQVSMKPDGRMTWVPLTAFLAKAETGRIARPEKVAAVLRRSRHVNASPFPILAGPVELIRDGGSAGVTEIGFVAPGETFVLGWGPDEAFSIKREATEHRETARLTGRQTITRTVRVFVSNLEAKELEFTLEERIPVSEIDDVTSEFLEKESTHGMKPDDQGIITFKVSLKPLKNETLTVVYRLSAPSSVAGI